ncbi:Esterase EstB [Aureliella helgolandensis]|uniref:Esterase EstB n=2 Tax=Aureliella helgolandensis TaxID=2527968 RepID=A0A518G938_9BACT|nr:Esterase EstB [Aureliella helgolandensis]
MNRRTALQTGIGLALASPLLAAVQNSRLEAAAAVLQHATSTGQIDAAALHVWQAERESAWAFGAATDHDAIFLLASISKPISVAAIMSLADAGEFDLNDSVQKFLPEFRGEGRERITMRHLFTHASGLPDQLPENSKLRAAHASLSEFVTAAIRTPLLFPAGTRFGYSSMAILLAAEVATRISGKPIARLVEETVLQPLEMKHSALGVGQLPTSDLMRCQVEEAAPESGAGAPSAQNWDWNSDYWRQLGTPWGGMHGSAADVARFLRAFLHPPEGFLKPETIALMLRNQNPPDMWPRGLGFDLGSGLSGPQRSPNVFGHTGSTGTLCWADPDSDSLCVVLTTLPSQAAAPHPRSLAAEHVAEAVR